MSGKKKTPGKQRKRRSQRSERRTYNSFVGSISTDRQDVHVRAIFEWLRWRLTGSE
jgi:hypothetical protein